MTLPNRVTIGAVPYRITTDQAGIDAACRAEGTDLYGRTHHGKLIINLEPTTAEPQQRVVLLHEVLHCCTSTCGITDEMGATDEERLVNRLAPLLLDVLRRNPTLLAYLTA